MIEAALKQIVAANPTVDSGSALFAHGTASKDPQVARSVIVVNDTQLLLAQIFKLLNQCCEQD
jgi:hypothetical protein